MAGKSEITVIGNTRDKTWTAEVKITRYKKNVTVRGSIILNKPQT